METPLPLAFNQRFVICENDKCKHNGQRRVAHLPHVGSGLYCPCAIMCECGMAPKYVKE